MKRVNLGDDLAQAIDDVRGDVPRDRWVRRALEQALGSEHRVGPDEDARSSPSPAPARPSGVGATAANLARQAKLNAGKDKSR